MKTEMRKRNLWERIKLAFRYLFSNDALLPVYQEGVESVFQDFKKIQEELVPFIKNLSDYRWRGDSAIAVPGMISTELYSINVMNESEAPFASIYTGDSPYPPKPSINFERLVYQQRPIQVQINSALDMIEVLTNGKREAALSLAQFLLDGGFIKYQQIASIKGGCKVVFYVNELKRV